MPRRIRQVEYVWHLRRLMAQREMYSTTDLMPLLAERGIELSAPQVYRLVTGTPERLNMRVLAALCDALNCTPTDLIETRVVEVGRRQHRKAAGGEAGPEGGLRAFRPTRAKIVADE